MISSKIVASTGNRDHKVIVSNIVTIIVLIMPVIVLVTVVIEHLFSIYSGETGDIYLLSLQIRH